MKPASIVIAALVCFAAVTVLAGPASAGTKYQTNIVPANVDGAGLEIDPTLSSKGKVKITDKGLFQAKVDGVTDGAGMLVTTDGSWKEKVSPTLTGDEYMVVIGGNFVALGVDFVFNLPIELKNGKGKAKVDASSLFGLIPGGTLRSTQQTAINVFGPIGAAAVTDCGTNLAAGGFVVGGAVNPCEGGDRIGVGGIELLP